MSSAREAISSIAAASSSAPLRLLLGSGRGLRCRTPCFLGDGGNLLCTTRRLFQRREKAFGAGLNLLIIRRNLFHCRLDRGETRNYRSVALIFGFRSRNDLLKLAPHSRNLILDNADRILDPSGVLA